MARGRGDTAAPPRRALVAAAKRVPLGGSTKVAVVKVGKPQEWQLQCWDTFDEVPVLKHAVWFVGNALAKLRLFAAVRPNDDPEADPIPVGAEGSGVAADLAASAEAELRRLRSANGSTGELLRDLAMNIEVAAECWLVGRGERTIEDPAAEGGTTVVPESWEIRSVSEVEWGTTRGPDGTSRPQAKVKGHPKAKAEPLDPELDSIGRIWQRHPRWSELADNHMRAVLIDALAWQRLTNQVLAEANSGLPAEMLLLPNSLSFGPADPTDPEEGEDADADPFLEALDQQVTEANEDPNSLAAVRWLVVRGEDEALEKVRTISMKRATEGLDAKIQARVRAIAEGVNLPVEVVLGHQQTTFANAEQVDQDTFEDYLQARCEFGCDALTEVFLHPNMLDAYPQRGDEVRRIFVWYDAAALIAQPDVEKNADQALQAGTISNATYRRVKGYSEDDAPDPLELLINAGLRRGILTADLTKALLDLLGEPIEVDVADQKVGVPVPPDEEARRQAAIAAAKQDRLLRGMRMIEQATGRAAPALAPPAELAAIDTTARVVRDNEQGRRLLAIDVDLRTRLQVAADQQLTKALERAGARLRTKANGHRDLLRNVPVHAMCAHLGPSLVAQLASTDELLAGAFDGLEQQFMAWGANAQEEALATVNQVVGGFTASERRDLGLRQADDLAEAWAWLRATLLNLATEVLFDPDPAGPTVGEFDPTSRVPTGLVREAVARAGGAAGLIATEGGGAFVVLADGGRRPAGGIGTGELLRDAMRAHDVMVEAYRWVYGPARRARPFEPHRDLDGLVFRNFDDPVLASTESWLPFEYFFPGDHKGCVCDVEPVIVPRDELPE